MKIQCVHDRYIYQPLQSRYCAECKKLLVQTHKAFPVIFHLRNPVYDVRFTCKNYIHTIQNGSNLCSLKIILCARKLHLCTWTNATKTGHFHPPFFLRMKLFYLGRETSINKIWGCLAYFSSGKICVFQEDRAPRHTEKLVTKFQLTQSCQYPLIFRSTVCQKSQIKIFCLINCKIKKQKNIFLNFW